MKIESRGQSRIFGKDSVPSEKKLGTTSPLICLQNDKRSSQSMPNNFDLKLFLEKSHCQMIEEALSMETHSELDVWLKESRIRALRNLSKDSNESSCSFLSRISQDMTVEPSAASKQSCFSSNPEYKLTKHKVSTPLSSESTLGYFDSHCHLDVLFEHEKFKGTYAEYIAQHKGGYPNNYKGCIAVFCKPWTFTKTYMWRRHLEQNNVWGAFGCHPKNAKDYNEMIEQDLKAALDHPKVKALGEIGLDYSERNTSSKSKQHEVFRRQLKIAHDRKLPIVIHCRDAEGDTIRIMLEILPRNYKFHLHCFTGTWESAQRWIAEFPNVFIGLTNLVTFPSAKPTHEVAKKLPLQRLLLETDAPYFVPRVFPKGKGSACSHPGMAIHVANEVAALKKVPVEEVLYWTQLNTKLVYNLP